MRRTSRRQVLDLGLGLQALLPIPSAFAETLYVRRSMGPATWAPPCPPCFSSSFPQPRCKQRGAQKTMQEKLSERRCRKWSPLYQVSTRHARRSAVADSFSHKRNQCVLSLLHLATAVTDDIQEHDIRPRVVGSGTAVGLRSSYGMMLKHAHQPLNL